MANLNFQQPPRSLGGGGGAARGFGGGGGGGHVTPTFGSGAAPQQLSPNRSQQLVGGAGAGTAARGGSQPGGGNSSIFAPRAFPPDRRSVPGGLGSVMPDWSSSTLGNMGSFGMPPSRSAYSSSSSSGAGAAGGGNNSFHSVFGGGGDSGSTPPVLDLSEFPSLTNRGGGGGGGGGAGGLGGGVGGGGQGDAMPNTMPGKQPYGPNMDSVTLTTASCNKTINEEELSVTLHSLPASFPSKSLTARFTVNALTLDTELGENELSTTELERLDECFMELGVTDKGDLENVRGLKLTTQGFLKGNFVESGDSHVVADNKYQEKLDAFELPTLDSLQESSVVVEDSSTVTEDEQQASFHEFRMSTTEFDSITEKFVKFGDNSIITSHVAPILASKLPELSPDEPDFMRKLHEVISNFDECTRVVDNNVQVFSNIIPCKFGGKGHPVEKVGTVFPVLDAPLETDNTDFFEVKFLDQRLLGKVDEAIRKPFLNKEGDVNKEAFIEKLSYLQPASKNLLGNLAEAFNSRDHFYDTCALHCMPKVLHMLCRLILRNWLVLRPKWWSLEGGRLSPILILVTKTLII
ncbi:uncharacterized protein LOC111049144 isoform X2 [Nilaparvata lugens]|uniref:uncharacterized protein LOC111049144 isoform X2 n=1 Tax=Nilaparvata lugens TaxID=108931 RepID=UPI00193DF8C9|nr:uncharacterized protein LOC111049144 isoform X2 [Nilaparvata lugens]